MTFSERSRIRILVTGSRRWPDVDAVRGALKHACRLLAPNAAPENITIVTGACPTGADAIAEKWAHIVGATIERHEANWADEGPPAGPMRNDRMVKAGADLCLAFWTGNAKSSGTFDCFQRCVKAGIPVFVVPLLRRPRQRAEEVSNG